MGASPRFMRRHFSLQGMFIGFVGCIGGIILGTALALYLPHTELFRIPGEVYKLDHLQADIRWQDLALILVCSMFICFISTFAPARKGSKLKPVDGLRY